MTIDVGHYPIFQNFGNWAYRPKFRDVRCYEYIENSTRFILIISCTDVHQFSEFQYGHALMSRSYQKR